MFLQAQRSQVQSGSSVDRSVDRHSLMSKHTCAPKVAVIVAGPWQIGWWTLATACYRIARVSIIKGDGAWSLSKVY